MMTKSRFIVVGLLFLTAFAGCKKERIKTNLTADYDSTVIVDWFDLLKTLTTETEGYTPPVAARAFGYISVALYEAVHNGIPDRTSLSGKLVELDIELDYDDSKKYHWPTVSHAVLSKMVMSFYHFTSPNRLAAIAELNAKYYDEFSATVPKAVYDRSIELAEETTRKIIAWSITDGGYNCHLNNFPSQYKTLVGEEYWQPTAPDFTPALQPYWGDNRPFLRENIDGTQPATPIAYSADTASQFFKEAKKVFEVVNNVTPEQIVIAEFWSDDPSTTATPPGHSIEILNQLIEENNLDLAEAAEAFAKLGIGVNDAFISCWKTKYETNYVRPITFINKYMDSNWNPILITPPFPEYTSGHSVQSGALAEIMTDIFGDNYTFTDKTHVGRTDIDGSPRTYSSFYELAEEAAISRLYGGIHYDEAIYLGLEQGYEIGKNVNNLDLTK